MPSFIEKFTAEFRWAIAAGAVSAATIVVAQTQPPPPTNPLPRVQPNQNDTMKPEPKQDNSGKSKSGAKEQSSANNGSQSNDDANSNPSKAAAKTSSNNKTGSQNQKNSDSRTSRDSTGSRKSQTAARRQDLRAPDIGVWFNRNSRDGLVISDISTKGAIAKVGFHEGDRIVSVNGHRISREPEFLEYLLDENGRDRIEVVVYRDGREETVYAQPALLLEEYSTVETDPLEQFGIVLDDRYDDRIVVWKVIPRSPAYYAGFREGDVLTTLRDKQLATRQEFVSAVGELQPGDVQVKVRRGDKDRDLSVDVPKFEKRSEKRADKRTDERTDRGENRQENSKDKANDRDNRTGALPRNR